MRKMNFWLCASLFVAAFTLSACGDDDNNINEPPKDETVKVTEETLKGTWEATIHDMAQGYGQRRRLYFDGKNYTSWHTHLTAGTINDADQGLKTVGNKEQGTWEYVDGKLILTPSKQWASYYLTAKSLNDPYYTVYLDYNAETMESSEWYETSESIIKDGVARDIRDNTDWYIQKWPVVSLTKTELSLKINMDVFKLSKQ
jgi:uncharacterized protein YegP (UPF0339 family)